MKVRSVIPIGLTAVAVVVAAADVGRAANDRELYRRMEKWIEKKGRLPTPDDLKTLGPSFRQAWEIYKHRRALSQTEKPTDDEVDLAREMFEWVKKNARDPRRNELNADAHLKACWNAYQKVVAYDNAQKVHRAEEALDDTKREYRRALNDLEKKNYRDAIISFRALLRNEKAKPVHKKIEAHLAAIEKAGQAEIAKAKTLAAEKKYREAMNALDHIVGAFEGTRASKDAREAWFELKWDPEVNAAMQARRADELLVLAAKAFADREYIEAITYYEEVVKQFEDSDQGKQAAKRLREIRADSTVMVEVAEMRRARDIKRLVDEADLCQKSGYIDKAIDRLQRLVNTYPESPEAADAKKRIEFLRKIR